MCRPCEWLNAWKPGAKLSRKQILLTSFAAFALLAATSAWADHSHTSGKFEGGKANKGTVTHTVQSGKNILTLSDDFVTPDTPAPHWQVIDSRGNAYLLQSENQRRQVQQEHHRARICARHRKGADLVRLAEANLGESSFDKPLQLTSK